MAQQFAGEQWKPVKFDFAYINEYKLEVSNYGRLRSFHKTSNGDIVKGSMVEGYKVIRLKFYTQRSEAMQTKLHNMQQQVFKLARKVKELKLQKANKLTIQESEKLLLTYKKKVSKKFKDETKVRTINYHALFHKLVAEYFLPTPAKGQTIIGHLNYDKLNNKSVNLKWMTPEENYAHQQQSPYVIEEKKLRTLNHYEHSKVAKLTTTKVMFIKKLLSEGKPASRIAKQFKVSDMQIIRIKRGENWSNIPAAT